MLEYVPTDLSLSVARESLAATSVGNYGIFAGGLARTDSGGLTYLNTSDAVSKTLSRTTINPLTIASYGLGGAHVGDYGLFAGGSTSSVYAANVITYNASLTRSTATSLGAGRYGVRGASLSNYAIFAGGMSYNSTKVRTYHTNVEAYNSSLTQKKPTVLSVGTSNASFSTVGNYAIYAGGMGENDSDKVDAYNTSLTKTACTPLSSTKTDHSSTSIGSYLIIGPGYNRGTRQVDTYSDTLVHGITDGFTYHNDRGFDAYPAASTDRYAVFHVGDDMYSKINLSINTYDKNLTHNYQEYEREHNGANGAGTRVGEYIIFAGGECWCGEGTHRVDFIDVYKDSAV